MLLYEQMLEGYNTGATRDAISKQDEEHVEGTLIPNFWGHKHIGCISGGASLRTVLLTIIVP